MTATPTEEALNRLSRAFSAPEPPRGDEPPGTSGVLIPVVAAPAEPWLLFTRRSEALSSHPGEISFPGGRVDPGDDGPLAAALRETHEEAGIPPDAVRVVGHLTDFMTFRGVLVCAYVGLVAPEAVPYAPASPDEVDEMLLVPEAHLLRPDSNDGTLDERRPHPLLRGVTDYEGRYLVDDPRRDRVVHYWHLSNGGTPIWGITGELLSRYLVRVHGWKPPRPAVGIREVSGFIP